MEVLCGLCQTKSLFSWPYGRRWVTHQRITLELNGLRSRRVLTARIFYNYSHMCSGLCQSFEQKYVTGLSSTFSATHIKFSTMSTKWLWCRTTNALDCTGPLRKTILKHWVSEFRLHLLHSGQFAAYGFKIDELSSLMILRTIYLADCTMPLSKTMLQ